MVVLVAVFFSYRFIAARLMPHPIPLTILYLSDLNGRALPFSEHAQGRKVVGGLSRIAPLIRKISLENVKKGSYTLVLGSGDLLRDQVGPQILNDCGLSAALISSHMFDFGMDNFLSLAANAKFKLLSGNLVENQSLMQKFTPYYIYEGENFKIAVVGATPKEAVDINPKNLEGLKIIEPVNYLKKAVDYLAPRVDLIIVLTGAGLEEDRRIAQNVDQIQLIIGRGNKFLKSQKIKRTLICQAHQDGLYLGRLDLKFRKHKIVWHKGELIPITDDLEEDRDLNLRAQEELGQLKTRQKQPIGKINLTLHGHQNKIRYKETNFGDLVADILKDEAKAEVALLTAGSIKGSIYAGEISPDSIFRVLPGNEKMVILNLTGEELREIIKKSIANLGKEGFLQVSGLTFGFRGDSLKYLKVSGEKLALNRSYRAAVSQRLADSEFGYDIFKKVKDKIYTERLISDLMIRHVEAQKTLSVKNGSRIRIN
jgi:5'-nucleotidase